MPVRGLDHLAITVADVERTLRFYEDVLGAEALYEDEGATVDDIREAVNMLEDAGRIARRLLGPAHPLTSGLGRDLLEARAALGARETPSPGSA